jgi:soluble lytic murein transglycosylase-like protein
MKPSAALIAIALLVFAGVEASAQETQPSRTPTMVVYDRAVVNNTAPATPKPDGAAAKQPAKEPGAKKEPDANPDSSVAAALATESQQPVLQPVVLPGARPDNQIVARPAVTATTGNPKYDQLVMQAAARHGVDPNLVMAVMHQESGGNWRARSYKGATGLMQLMPATARRLGVTDIYDPAQNIEGGTKDLRFLLDTFNGDVKLALAGYNAGEGAVMKYGYQVPPYRETQNYVRSISARYGRSKHTAVAAAPAVAANPAAPEAMTFSRGTSKSLSNNY